VLAVRLHPPDGRDDGHPLSSLGARSECSPGGRRPQHRRRRAEKTASRQHGCSSLNAIPEGFVSCYETAVSWESMSQGHRRALDSHATPCCAARPFLGEESLQEFPWDG